MIWDGRGSNIWHDLALKWESLPCVIPKSLTWRSHKSPCAYKVLFIALFTIYFVHLASWIISGAETKFVWGTVFCLCVSFSVLGLPLPVPVDPAVLVQWAVNCYCTIPQNISCNTAELPQKKWAYKRPKNCHFVHFLLDHAAVRAAWSQHFGE